MGHDQGLKWIRVAAALALLAAMFVGVSPSALANAASECSGTVFRDDNYDGARDADEIGIGNVTVNVYSDAPVADTLVATTITAADGSYTLEALPDDLAMRVEFVDLPAGHLEGPAGPDSGPLIRFTNSSNCGALDAGIVLPSACSVLQVEVGNRVWFDEDADGMQDAEETAVAGVTVSLYDTSGTLVATTVTDAFGRYTFSSSTVDLVPNTDYLIRFDNPADYGLAGPLFDTSISPAFQGGDPGRDSDAVEVGGFPEIAVTTGDLGFSSHQYDFGVQPPASIGDVIWLDLDGDGVQGTANWEAVRLAFNKFYEDTVPLTAAEPGLAGVTVELYAPGADSIVGTADDVLEATTVTDGQGYYLFRPLDPGTYRVAVDTTTLPAGVTATYDFDGGTVAPDDEAVATVVSGQNQIGVDWGYAPDVDLELVKTPITGTEFGGLPVYTQDGITWSVVVTNQGESVAPGPLTVTDWLGPIYNPVPPAERIEITPPAGVTCSEPTDLEPWDVLPNFTVDIYGFTCEHAADLGPGESFEIEVFTPTDWLPPFNDGTNVGQSNIATVYAQAPELSDDSLNYQYVYLNSLNPDLTISKTRVSVGDSFNSGETIEWEVVVSNAGPGDWLRKVTVTDIIRNNARLEYVSAGGPGWTCDAVVAADTTVTCTSVEDVAEGADFAPITIVTTVAEPGAATFLEDLSADLDFTNTASIPTSVGDADRDNNSSTAGYRLNAPNLFGTKRALSYNAATGEASWQVNGQVGTGNEFGIPAGEWAVVEEQLGAQQLVSWDGHGAWTCYDGPGQLDDGELLCTTPGPWDSGTTLPPLDIVTIPQAEPGVPIPNTACVYRGVDNGDDTWLQYETVIGAGTTACPRAQFGGYPPGNTVTDLAIVKSHAVDPWPVGTVQDWVLTITQVDNGAGNAGFGLDAPLVRDELPPGLELVTLDAPGYTCTLPGPADDPATPLDESRLVSCQRDDPFDAFGDVDTITLSLQVQGNALEPFVNNATVSPTLNAERTATLANNVTLDEVGLRYPDLTIEKTGPATARVGEAFDFTIQVENLATDATALAPITVTDVFPSGLSFSGFAGTDWTCESNGGTPPTVTCVYTKDLGPSEAAPPLTLSATAPTVNVASMTNAVSVDAGIDANSANNAASAAVDVLIPELGILKTASAPVIALGTDTLTYSLAVSNRGDGAASAPVVVADTLPAGVTLAAATAPDADWDCAGDGAQPETVTCTFVGGAGSATAFPAGDTSTIELEVAISPDAIGGLSAGSITNAATITTPDLEQVATDNTSAVTTQVVHQAEVGITKSHDAAVVGEDITFSVEVFNNGPSPASDVVVTDELQAGLTLISATGPGWMCTSTGGSPDVVTCTLAGDLPAGGTAPLSIVATLGSEAYPAINNSVSVATTTAPVPGSTVVPYTVDQELLPFGCVGDYVWEDANDDGVQDPAEQPVAGVVLNLMGPGPDGVLGTEDDEVLATTTTDDNGAYSFDYLPPADYRIVVDQASLPAALLPSFDLDGGADADALVGVGGNEPSDRVDVDFGLVPAAAIGDFVFFDADGDGVQDAADGGAAGVTVNLYDASGTLVATTTTDADGAYRFDGLRPGVYEVEVISPAGFGFSPNDQGPDDGLDSDPDPSTGRTGPIDVGPGEVLDDVDAGLFALAAIGDRVWFDADADGIQDVGELGIPGVLVSLYSADDVLVGTTTTGADGSYLFEDLLPGDYYLEFTPPAGFGFSEPDQGGDDAADSDVDVAAGLSPVVSLDSGDVGDVDAGLHGDASLGGVVWEDLDGDGARDGAEPTVNAVPVTLFDADGNLVASTVTDATGAFLFENLPPGDYQLEFGLPVGFAFTIADVATDDIDSDPDAATGVTGVITVGPSEAVIGWDAGLVQPVDPGPEPESVYDFAIAKAVSGDLVQGQEVSWTVTVTNLGPDAPSGGVTVTDTLPAGLSAISASGDGWLCTGDRSEVTCAHPGDFVVGEGRSFTIVTGVHAEATGTLTNGVVLSFVSGETSIDNNVATAGGPVLTVEGDLPVTGFDLPGFLQIAAIALAAGALLLGLARLRSGRKA